MACPSSGATGPAQDHLGDSPAFLPVPTFCISRATLARLSHSNHSHLAVAVTGRARTASPACPALSPPPHPLPSPHGWHSGPPEFSACPQFPLLAGFGPHTLDSLPALTPCSRPKCPFLGESFLTTSFKLGVLLISSKTGFTICMNNSLYVFICFTSVSPTRP